MNGRKLDSYTSTGKLPIVYSDPKTDFSILSFTCININYMSDDELGF